MQKVQKTSARFFAALPRKSRHPRESGNPSRFGPQWAPASAGATPMVIFIGRRGLQAHDNSLGNHVIPAKAGIYCV